MKQAQDDKEKKKYEILKQVLAFGEERSAGQDSGQGLEDFTVINVFPC